MKLVIDGNSLLNVITTATIYSGKNADLCRPFYRSMDKWVIKSTAAEYYDSQLYRYLLNIINSFPGIDGIYIASDSISWRKIFYKKKLEMFAKRADFSDIESGYKGKRKTDTEQKEQNLELIKYLTSETLLRLSQKIPGLNLISVKGLEGDDIVYRLTEKFKQTDDVIVWSNDSDLHQILDKNVYIIGSFDKKTKSKRLFRLDESHTDTDYKNKGGMTFNFINDNCSITKSIIDSLVQRGYYSNNFCDPYYDLYTKILCGDKASDNIPPVYSTTDSKGKIINLTKVRYSDTILTYLEKEGYTPKTIIDGFKVYDSDILIKIVGKICDLFKVNYNENKDSIESYLKFNIRMILLDKNMIPVEILTYLDDVISFIENKNEKFNVDTFKGFVSPYINTEKN